MKVACIFPGQGSQYVGMGKEFYEKFDMVKDLFEQASDLISLDLKKLCFSGPDEVLTSTQNVQPAITLVNVACYEVLKSYGVDFEVFAGHSLGEYSALYASGVMSFEQVIKLTRLRGICMHDAAKKNPGAMAAIMNISLEELEQICSKFGSEVANINSQGQVIVTGSTAEVDKTIDECRKRGVKRCIKLNVSGPWHSKYMKDAQKRLEQALEEYNFMDPLVPVICNVDAEYLLSGEKVREKLALQVCKPVLWLESMKRLLDDGYDVFVEVGPKKVLSGLMKRISRKTKILQVEDSGTLDALLRFLKSN